MIQKVSNRGFYHIIVLSRIKRGAIMECREIIYEENVLSYIIGNYISEEYLTDLYEPDCFIPFDANQAVVFRTVDSVESAEIERFGFSAIPNVYGLMSIEALEASGVLRIRRQPFLDLFGQGVLIGFVDTGIDYEHEAFRNADGTTRIVSIWDQTVQEGAGPQPFFYGAEYTRERIDEALLSENPSEIVPQQDEVGHGTFLAGIAAGNEKREREFGGVAPLAELVIVKCKPAKAAYRNYYGIRADVPAFQEDDVMAGVTYLLEVARRELKPIVICVGMGTSMGSHRGASNLSVFMDRYATYQGVGMFTCAGNEGNARHHHHIQKQEDTISINVEQNISGFMAQLWWQTPGNLLIDLTAPGGEEVEGIRAVSGGRFQHRFIQENTTVELFFGVSQEITREQVVVFRFLLPKTGLWKIRTRFDYENPDFHIWLPIRQFLEADVFFLTPDPNTTITNPGTGENVLTVSAYDSMTDSLYLRSGRGFSVEGTVKPEVAAPGVELIGTYPGNRYGTMSGTSVSAALATGIGALFMESLFDIGMTGATGLTISEMFIRGAVPRGMPRPNAEWGYGMVDAYASLTME